jgi:hypothetical protein
MYLVKLNHLKWDGEVLTNIFQDTFVKKKYFKDTY